MSSSAVSLAEECGTAPSDVDISADTYSAMHQDSCERMGKYSQAGSGWLTNPLVCKEELPTVVSYLQVLACMAHAAHIPRKRLTFSRSC